MAGSRIVTLLRALVATPSQAFVDDLGAIARVVSGWLREHGVPHVVLGPRKAPLAVVIHPPRHADDEVLVLDACLDTAPVGERASWSVDPFRGTVRGGWLHGRGAADSKAAVAIFCELARLGRLDAGAAPPTRGRAGAPRRRVTVVFDNDEHSGGFGGIRAYLREFGHPRHCVIGYPGLDEVVAGSRGFWRTTLVLRGAMEHSGARSVPAGLATTKLARLVAAFERLSATPAPRDAAFPLPPRASITGLATGAKSFSVTPPAIECHVDIRLTPRFTADDARAFVERELAAADAAGGHAPHGTIGDVETWPPYRTPNDALLPRLLQAAAARHLGTAPPLTVAGPSNIGNLLAVGGTQVLAGFGVNYRNLHAPDERIELASIPLVRDVYADVARAFLAGEPAAVPTRLSRQQRQ